MTWSLPGYSKPVINIKLLLGFVDFGSKWYMYVMSMPAPSSIPLTALLPQGGHLTSSLPIFSIIWSHSQKSHGMHVTVANPNQMACIGTSILNGNYIHSNWKVCVQWIRSHSFYVDFPLHAVWLAFATSIQKKKVESDVEQTVKCTGSP